MDEISDDMRYDIFLCHTPFKSLDKQLQQAAKKFHKKFKNQYLRSQHLNNFIQTLDVSLFNQKPSKETKHRPISKGQFPKLEKKGMSFSLIDCNLEEDLNNVKIQSQCIANHAKVLFDLYQKTPQLLLCKSMYGKQDTICKHALLEDNTKIRCFNRCIYVACNSLAIESNQVCQMKLADSYILAFSKQGQWNLFYGQYLDHQVDKQKEKLTIHDKVFTKEEISHIIYKMHKGLRAPSTLA